jgi:hypothetical protein
MTALKQGDGQPLFELTHGIADGGRHPVQLLRRRAEAAVTGDGINHFQRVFRPHFLPAKFLNACDKY